MIQLIGIKHNVGIEIREKLSIIPKNMEDILKRTAFVCKEAVIINTCNRTEIYFDSSREDEGIVKDIFECLGWDQRFVEYTFHVGEDGAVRHLMETVCGLHSRILGEEQILGQVKDAYEKALKLNAIKGVLARLFQTAVTCGKEFRTKAGLDRVPVSTASMVVREARKRGIKKFMIIGFGEIGNLVSKYITDDEYRVLYIAARDKNSVDAQGENIKVINFKDRKNYYPGVECIISCTSAPHTVINRSDLPENKLLIFDMAVPRDVEQDVGSMENVEVFDIDSICSMQDESCQVRRDIIEKYRYIIDDYIDEFYRWKKLRELSPYIRMIKENGDSICRQRSSTFRNKRNTRDNEELVNMLLKSTSNVFVNRAIEVLKEEHLKGRGEECMKIIEKIFLA